MRKLGPASEEEMIAEFVAAEVDSSRFGGAVRGGLRTRGLTRSLVDHPDLSNGSENATRASLLNDYRGWTSRTALFDRWPDEIDWHRAVLTAEDLPRLLYAGTQEFAELSNGSYSPVDGVRRIESGEVPSSALVGVEAAKSIARRIKSGDSLFRVIAIGDPDEREIVLVEGHSRINGYLLAGFPEELEILYGETSVEQLRGWGWYPKRV